MKTLSKILDPILVKLYYNGYTDRIAGITEHAEAVKNNWLSEAQEAIAKELMGCLGEEELEDVDDYPFEYGKQVGRNEKLLEVRARLTAFIGKDSNENS